LGLDTTNYGTHTLRRTKATLIYRRTKNLRAVQLLLGHTKLDYLPCRTMSRSDHSAGFSRENMSNVAPLIVLGIIIAALVGSIMYVAQRDRVVRGNDCRYLIIREPKKAGRSMPGYFSQSSTEPLLTSSARVSAAAASPAQERDSGALPESAPLHLRGEEPFGKGS